MVFSLVLFHINVVSKMMKYTQLEIGAMGASFFCVWETMLENVNECRLRQNHVLLMIVYLL